MTRHWNWWPFTTQPSLTEKIIDGLAKPVMWEIPQTEVHLTWQTTVTCTHNDNEVPMDSLSNTNRELVKEPGRTAAIGTQIWQCPQCAAKVTIRTTSKLTAADD